MKIAKRFRWEAAHRLPWHDGDCRHLHGHSYRMMVEVTGEPGAHGMLMDFKHLKRLVGPLVDCFDHATLVSESDADLLGMLERLEMKRAVLPYDATAENLCRYVMEHLGAEGYEVLDEHGVERVRVTIWETETCYAELERPLTTLAGARPIHAERGTA
jgi:6-pyruvoyltetrahydropterin/6-carboxytetrahydropterin synthase